jgi:hypothetical protein
VCHHTLPEKLLLKLFSFLFLVVLGFELASRCSATWACFWKIPILLGSSGSHL